MKPTPQLHRQLTLIIFSALIGFTLHAIATEPFIFTAEVVGVKGQARYSTNQSNWQLLKKGDLVLPGSTIQTAKKSTVTSCFGPNIPFIPHPNSFPHLVG
ncbi:MAG: hypothetical protein JWQ71_4072 [Pedosphaera sp.]|nr:hypothetical protein [Pedosphaera sp.]